MADQNTVGDGPGPDPNSPYYSYYTAMTAAQASRASVQSAAAAASSAAEAASDSELGVNATPTPTDDSTLPLTAATSLTLSEPTGDAVSTTGFDESTTAAAETTAADSSTEDIASYLTATTSSSIPSPFPGSDGSSTPSTFATSTSPVAADTSATAITQSPTSLSGTYSATQPAQAESQGATLPPLSQDRHHGLTGGEIAAAVVVPLLFLIALIAGVFFLRRRRRTMDRNIDTNQGTNSTMPPPAMKQTTNHATHPSTSSAVPILTSTSTHNPTYYTGLDTVSSHQPSTRDPSNDYAQSPGGTTFYEPPPAYKKPRSSHSEGTTGAPPSYNHNQTEHPQTRNIPQLALPADTGSGTFDPFSDPESPISTFSRHGSLDDALAARSPVSPVDNHDTSRLMSPSQQQRPETSRTNTGLSINSDAYSDTASVHSARAARLSIGFGGAHVVDANHGRPEPEERSLQWE